jgi:hypothetical protein
MIRLLYHLQKDAQYKPLLVALLLFVFIDIGAFVGLRGRGIAAAMTVAFVYALAGYAVFQSGNRVVYLLALAVPLAGGLFAALVALTGSVPMTPGIVFTILLAVVLLLEKLVRPLPAAPQTLFLTLFAAGLAAALAAAWLAR